MDPRLVLDRTAGWAAPGGEERIRVTVHNPDDATVQYRLDVLGDATRWAGVEPRQVSVPPGTSGTADVVFRPPNAHPPGPVPFGVRCVDLRRPTQVAVTEGDVQVGAVRGLHATIEPAVGTGRWRGRYVASLRNVGPAPVPVTFTATDPRGLLGCALAPRELTVEPGATGSAYLAIRPRPLLVGGHRTHPVKLEYRRAGDPGAGTLTARFEQRPVLGVLQIALVVVAVLALLVGLVFWAVRRPAPPPGTAGPLPATTAVEEVRGHFVIYGPPTPIDDRANLGAAERLLASLQAVGVDARIVDSRNSGQLDDGAGGLWVVLRDGFPEQQSALAECAARRALAPHCIAVAPRN